MGERINIFLHLFFMLELILNLDESTMTFNIGVGKLQINQILNNLFPVKGGEVLGIEFECRQLLSVGGAGLSVSYLEI